MSLDFRTFHDSGDAAADATDLVLVRVEPLLVPPLRDADRDERLGVRLDLGRGVPGVARGEHDLDRRADEDGARRHREAEQGGGYFKRHGGVLQCRFMRRREMRTESRASLAISSAWAATPPIFIK